MQFGTVMQVIKDTAKEHGTSVEALLRKEGPIRRDHIHEARQLAMLRAKEAAPGVPYTVLGRLFHRDRTTVMHGIRRAKERMEAGQ